MFDPLTPILVFLITAGVKEFCDKVLGRPVPSEASAIVAAFVAALVLFANALGALIPANWTAVVAQIVTLIVMIASAFGIHATVKSFAK
jgi:hypothetical protein